MWTPPGSGAGSRKRTSSAPTGTHVRCGTRSPRTVTGRSRPRASKVSGSRSGPFSASTQVTGHGRGTPRSLECRAYSWKKTGAATSGGTYVSSTTVPEGTWDSARSAVRR
ncbi:hypothetical protein GCM10020001_062160 [Nonomuraea salmonea]